MGLQLRPQAAKAVGTFLRVQKETEAPALCERLVEETKAYLRSKAGVVETFIDLSVMETVIANLSAKLEASGGSHEALKGVEAWDPGNCVEVYNTLSQVRPLTFDKGSKADRARVGEKDPLPKLFSSPSSKYKIYHERYNLLRSRTLAQGRFVLEAVANAQGALEAGQEVLTPVGSLVGNPGKKTTFGLLTRVAGAGPRRWALEDCHKEIPVEFTLEESEHLITDGAFVLARGELVNGIFKVSHLESPPAQSRQGWKENHDVPLTSFGGNLTDDRLGKLEEWEQGDEGFYVVLSEVHLDSAKVLERLGDLFEGYEQAGPPAAYVFMGNFSSQTFSPTNEGVRLYREGFERLATMLQRLEGHQAKGTGYIFLPGPGDPGPQTLPCPGLPSFLTGSIAEKVPGVVMASNPCRLRHFSRELVFFRHDVLRLLRRHEVVPLREPMGDTVSAKYAQLEMVHFLYDQAHLVPLPLAESNVLWDFDHTLWLYPLPHAVFIGGVSPPFDETYKESSFCSVGAFSQHLSFYAFTPVTGLLEICDVPDREG